MKVKQMLKGKKKEKGERGGRGGGGRRVGKTVDDSAAERICWETSRSLTLSRGLTTSQSEGRSLPTCEMKP